MAWISFKNTNITIEAKVGARLTDCIRKAGLHIETPCNCIGSCGKCRVKAAGELYPPAEEEKKLINPEDGIRLACMARVKGDVEIELLGSSSSLKTINRGFSITVEPDPIDKAGSSVLGAAVDIGTTGISAYLVDLESGEVLSKASCLNPQTQYGGDVLTRISYCMNNADGSRLLKEAIINKIDEIIGELTGDRYSRSSVYRITIAGNTTMLHFLLGVDASSIARAPYRPVFTDRIDLRALELGININRNGMLTMLPSASGYIGADILAGVIATGFNKKRESSIFIDIGTNGEIAAINSGRMAATSTAAGPALEGMNISCGCRAEAGAIDSFCIDDNCNISFTTIGGVEAKGICGSGLIDIAAFFVKREIVLKNGRFNPDLDHRVKDRFRDKRFYITEDIFISQKDIRQIQLAKGAIAAGIAMLLAEIDLPLEKVSEAVIAGAFGYHINPQSITDIGLIPKGFKGKITFAGNSSVEGARIALISKSMLKSMEALKDKITILELSTKDTFQEYFVKELSF